MKNNIAVVCFLLFIVGFPVMLASGFSAFGYQSGLIGGISGAITAIGFLLWLFLPRDNDDSQDTP